MHKFTLKLTSAQATSLETLSSEIGRAFVQRLVDNGVDIDVQASMEALISLRHSLQDPVDSAD